jgi:hypothetical protein
VEVRIGVQHAARELIIESTQAADEIQKSVSDAISGKSGLFTLEDERGRVVLVPAEKLAYVEIGESETRRVGFGAI